MWFLCCKFSKTNSVDFLVLKFSYLTSKIIPFFEKYALHGVKKLEFKDFCQIVDIMKDNGHRTTKGIEEFFKIKDKINKGKNNQSLLMDS
jgi:hypothetical protein